MEICYNTIHPLQSQQRLHSRLQWLLGRWGSSFIPGGFSTTLTLTQNNTESEIHNRTQSRYILKFKEQIITYRNFHRTFIERNKKKEYFKNIPVLKSNINLVLCGESLLALF